MRRVIIDIESNNFLQKGLDYSRTPYKLKPTYQVWCVVCRDVVTDEVFKFVGFDQITKDLRYFLRECDEVIGHNIIAFDLPVLFLWAGITYRVGYVDGDDMVAGHLCKITDTLVLSKLLYSDTINGHSLEDWGNRLGNYKQSFHSFDEYSEEMLDYCVQDTSVNRSMYFKFMEEMKSWKWGRAFRMESKLADIQLAQELYGFRFYRERALSAVEELTALMEQKRAIVDPHLPPKTLNKGEQKEYIPPKLQFKKDGSPSANMEKFAAKHGWKLVEREEWQLEGLQTWTLPLPAEKPLITKGIASVEDNDHVKGYLLDLGWVPKAWKERDLTVDSKKHKRTKEEFETAVKRYVEQTLNGPYKTHRLELLGVDEDMLEWKLLSHPDIKKPLRVPTSPQVTLPPEKELCPGLVILGERVAFARDFADFMTYRHRKNSIAGGVDEDGEPSSGFLVAQREEDGRIPTPADTNGCNTGRYQHRVVCNIPRASSLYGETMRGLFGVADNKYQLGFDFASLEARIEGHYVYRYPGGPELAAALLLEKPHDIHTKMAKKLGVTRDAAKSINYALN